MTPPSALRDQAARDRVERALALLAAGTMVVVADDHDRENEGDLVFAAEHATPAMMAFMVRHTSGIVCAPLTTSEAARLELPPMVVCNTSAHTTAFTVSVDLLEGTTTGISAADRSATVRALADPARGPADFARPGHIFPLVARDGGVLERAGHTEAAVDLCRLAGCCGSAVICELVEDTGEVTRGPRLTAFSQAHGLHLVTVADLIAYRHQTERLIRAVAEARVETAAGPARRISLESIPSGENHVVFEFGKRGRGPTEFLVRAGLIGPDGLPFFAHGDPETARIARAAREGHAVMLALGHFNPPEELRVMERWQRWRCVHLPAQTVELLGLSTVERIDDVPVLRA